MPQLSYIDTLERANPADIAFLDAQRQWHEAARPDQILPLTDWYTTLAMAGRGWGP